MKGFNHEAYSDQQIRDFLAARLGDYVIYDDEGSAFIDTDPLNDPNYWLAKFQEVFGGDVDQQPEELITEQRVSTLIGEYERSQAFVNTPWKSYVEGNNNAISADAKRGAILFYTSSMDGGANCSSCHSGDFFTDESFHNLAMPQVGSGKGNGADGSKDFGRARETDPQDIAEDKKDKFAFRTPSLINVEVTGPWSHTGAYMTLEAVIKHHSNADNAITNFDDTQLFSEGVSNLDKMEVNTREALDAPNFGLETLNLSDIQIEFLVEFLRALTDPCVTDSNCLARWIPDAERVGPNEDQLNAVIIDSSFPQ
jgi:cytochrome c peroxidase